MRKPVQKDILVNINKYMPRLLEQKLKREYGSNKHAIYGTMNKIGAMHGSKETKKGRAIERAMEKKKKWNKDQYRKEVDFLVAV